MAGANRAGRRMPVRTTTITLEGDYAGWTAEVRTNPPVSVFRQLIDESFASKLDALATVVLAWDWSDENGEALPQPSEGGLDRCPLDLVKALIDAYSTALNTASEVPKG